MSKKEKTLFWVSYADLMTSLFFIMLMLFITASTFINKENNYDELKLENDSLKQLIGNLQDSLRVGLEEKEQLKNINDVIKKLDPKYFEYVDEYKKSKLKITVNYPIDKYNIDLLDISTQNELKQAGKSLMTFVDATSKEFSDVQFLLIIEGQASKTGPTDHNYELSYQRAYALKDFWENSGISFDAKNCEVIIGGSGDGIQSGTGLMRDTNERLNQRFLIHIIPKPGYVDAK